MQLPTINANRRSNGLAELSQQQYNDNLAAAKERVGGAFNQDAFDHAMATGMDYNPPPPAATEEAPQDETAGEADNGESEDGDDEDDDGAAEEPDGDEADAGMQQNEQDGAAPDQEGAAIDPEPVAGEQQQDGPTADALREAAEENGEKKPDES